MSSVERFITLCLHVGGSTIRGLAVVYGETCFILRALEIWISFCRPNSHTHTYIICMFA